MKLKVKKNVFALVLACLMVFIAVAGCAQNTLTPTPGSGAPGPGEPAPSDDTVPSVYGVRPVVGGYVLYNGQRQPDANVYWDGYAWSTSMSGGEWSNDPIEYVPGVHYVYAVYNGESSPTYQVVCDNSDVRLDLEIGGTP